MVGMGIRVFLLDDHEIVRRGLHDLLSGEEDIEVVGEAGTAEQALQRIPLASPDVAILDVQLPDGTGVEVCREVRSSMPEVRCVMLTSFSDDEALLEAVVAGAAGYVLKQVRNSEIVEMVRKVAAGESLLDPQLKARVEQRIRLAAEGDERIRTLTDQERRILSLIAEGKTNRQIADEVFLAEKTVKNYITNVLSKMGMSRRTEAAVYVARLDERQSRWH
jgi:DNA-binding NarL/FixJ family response regulator